jgi:hypothetical protein
MTALVQFDPIPEIQIPTIWIGLLWGMNITYKNPDLSIAQLASFDAQLVINTHEGNDATNIVTWDAGGGFITLADTAPNIQIQVASAITRLRSPYSGAFVYFTVTDGSGEHFQFFKGPVDIAYGGV